jgi:pyridoxamine 5'-phosphate oxidase
MTDQLAALRLDYRLASLQEEDTYDDPLLQFQKWFNEAMAAEIEDVNAMALASVDTDGKPHNRFVLLKGLEEGQFIFFTNYNSHKGTDLAANPHVAATFYWVPLQRQLRIEGHAEKISFEASEAYFHQRPRSSQLGAWASHQSEVTLHRNELEERYAALEKQYENQTIPCPPHWGGYAIKPTHLEFWQGRSSRMHDRIAYTLENGVWMKQRLNP